MSELFDEASIAEELFRVGRPPDPWAFVDWAFAGPDGTFGNRWDDAFGRYRVLYAASQRLGAFVETLAHFRPDPHVVAEYQTMATDDDEDFAAPGVVPKAWCADRVITYGVPTDVRGRFVVVSGTTSLSTLRDALAPRVVHYRLHELDAAAVRLTAPRKFTQEISSYIEAQIGSTEESYAGMYYRSKFGDDIENWAIFERQEMNGRSPVLLVDREPVHPDDAGFRAALGLLGLALEE